MRVFGSCVGVVVFDAAPTLRLIIMIPLLTVLRKAITPARRTAVGRWSSIHLSPPKIVWV